MGCSSSKPEAEAPQQASSTAAPPAHSSPQQHQDSKQAGPSSRTPPAAVNNWHQGEGESARSPRDDGTPVEAMGDAGSASPGRGSPQQGTTSMRSHLPNGVSSKGDSSAGLREAQGSLDRDLADIDSMLADPALSREAKEAHSRHLHSQHQGPESTSQQPHQPDPHSQPQPDDPWSALQSNYRPQQARVYSPLYERSPKRPLDSNGNSHHSGRGTKAAPLPPLKEQASPQGQPAKWEGEDGEVMMMEDGPGGPKGSGRSRAVSGRKTKSPPSGAPRPGGLPKEAGWGAGDLAQPGTLMLDDDETLDELEVFVEAPPPDDGHAADHHTDVGSSAPDGRIPSHFKVEEDLALDDLEEIDELFQVDKSQQSKQPSLQAKLRKYQEVTGDDM